MLEDQDVGTREPSLPTIASDASFVQVERSSSDAGLEAYVEVEFEESDRDDSAGRYALPTSAAPNEYPEDIDKDSRFVEAHVAVSSTEPLLQQQPSRIFDGRQQCRDSQAAQVAKDIQHVAYEYTTKLTASFKSALGGLGKTEAGISQLAGGLTSWWSSLDPASQERQKDGATQVQASTTCPDVHELLGLLPDEDLVESFRCKLVQTYGCNHNSFTPTIQMAFQGTLYITNKHACFSVEERNRRLPFKVPHCFITKAVRERPQRKGIHSDILHLGLSQDLQAGQQFLAFKDFEAGSALESALALVELFTEIR